MSFSICTIYCTLSEAYLERCVSSLCHQTYPNIEIILVDDGSPDNSGKMCDQMAQQDSRIQVIHKENSGLSDARNVGIELASGDYIAFVDSDDWYDPSMLKILLELCEKNNAGIAECSYRSIFHERISTETTCSGMVMEMTPVQAIESNLDWKYCTTVAWNKLYRRDIVGSIRYPVGKIHEDEFTTHLFYLASNKIMYIDLALVNYERRNLSSITSAFKPQNLEACEAFREKVHLIWKHSELQCIDRKMCNNYCFILLDCIKKCEASYPNCIELKETILNAYMDYEKLKEHGIDEPYIVEMDALFEKYNGLFVNEVA